MAHLIDKDALVAEIEKEIKDIYAGREYVGIPSWEEREIDGLEKAIEILNTLETKEVDLEKEKDDYWNKLCDSEFGELLERDAKWFDDIAKHFFELGFKAQKGE